MYKANRRAKQHCNHILAVCMFTFSCMPSNTFVVSGSSQLDSGSNLFDVIRCGSTTKLKKMLKKKPDLAIRNKYGLCLITHAVMYAGCKTIRLLLRYGAPVCYYDGVGSTPLSSLLALSRQNSLEVCKLLLANGANPNQKNRAGVSLLQRTCRAKLEKGCAMRDILIKALIERGAHVTSDMIDVPQKYHDFAQEQALLFKESLCDMEKTHNVPRMVTRMIGDFAGVAQEALPEAPDYSAWNSSLVDTRGAVGSSRPAKRRRLS